MTQRTRAGVRPVSCALSLPRGTGKSLARCRDNRPATLHETPMFNHCCRPKQQPSGMVSSSARLFFVLIHYFSLRPMDMT